MSLEDGKYLRRRRRKVIDVRGRESSLDGGGAESGLSESGEEEERKRVTILVLSEVFPVRWPYSLRR